MSIDTLLSGNMNVIALAGDVSSQIRPSPTIQRASRDVPENRLVHEQHAPVAESPKSPLKTQSQGEIKGTYKRTYARIHARVRYPRDVGSEAQFFVRANEGESRLGPHCPEGRRGHPSRTPSGESALRWPCRLRRAIWTKSDAGAAPDPGSDASSFAGPRGCRLGRSGPVGAAGLCPERPPGLLYHARAPLFGRGSMLQTRFCLCTQYCHWTRAGAISALPIRAFRACGCCGPMPRRSPDSSTTRALLSLAVAVCYRRASACAHTVLLQHPLEMSIAPVKCPGP